jgi:hypothetical protein
MKQEVLYCKEDRHKGKPVLTTTYDSVAEMSRYCTKVVTPDTTAKRRGRLHKDRVDLPNSWAGKLTCRKVLELAATGGDAKLAKRASGLADSIELPCIDGIVRSPEMMVGPGTVVIPALLSGHPCHMLNIGEQEDQSPVRVYYNLSGSAGINHDDLEMRGLVAMTFAELLSRTRPVEMFCYVALDGKIEGHEGINSVVEMFQLDFRPVSIAEAGLVFGTQTLCRGVMFGLGEYHADFGGGWPWHDHDVATSTGRDSLPDATDNDVILPAIYMSDDLIKDPIGWLTRTLSKYLDFET